MHRFTLEIDVECFSDLPDKLDSVKAFIESFPACPIETKFVADNFELEIEEKEEY